MVARARKRLTNDQLTQARVDDLVARGVSRTLAPFRLALIPLFSHAGRRPQLIGTGVGLQAGDERLVLTASHVLRDFGEDTIYVPAGTEWATLSGVAHHAKTPNIIDSQDDRVDAGVLQLDSESRQNWTGWLTPAQLLPGATAGPHDGFVVVGYPRSKQKYNFEKRSITPRAWPYFGIPVPSRDYEKARAQPRVHVVLGFDRENTVHSGRVITAPSVRGVSGGMLLAAPGVYSPELRQTAALAGMFIEWPHPLRYLVSTRIDLHLSLIEQQIPILRGVVPSPRSMAGRSVVAANELG